MRRLLVKLFKTEKTVLKSLSYIFCSDDFLLDINRNFLNHDYYTDIITFNLASKGQPVEGEVYISLDRVRENAGLFETSFAKELHRVIIHGALHLSGYGDASASEKRLMRQKEDEYLAKLMKL